MELQISFRARGQELKSAFIPLLSIATEKADINPVEFFKKSFVKSGDGYYWQDGDWFFILY